MENKDLPAFPAPDNRGLPSGLNKREYVAAKVISGLMAVNDKGSEFKNWDEAADEAVRVTILVTDKLLFELSKPQP